MIRASALLICLVALLPAAGQARADSNASAPMGAAVDEKRAAALFDEVWQTVRDRFYDRKMHGLDWDAIGARHRPEAISAGTDRELADRINAMLAELGASHLGYYTPAETAYYDLADIFARSLRHQIKTTFPSGEVSYVGIGLFTRRIEGQIFVTGVLDGMPADKAGLKVGDEIVDVEGDPYEPIRSFEDKSGRKVALTIRRERGGAPQQVFVTPQRIYPNKGFLEAMRVSARVIDHAGARIGYIHVWSYARADYQDLLAQLISTGPLKDADALIWDLRDGWGGADPAYLDIFNRQAPTMITTDRDGDRHVVNARWRRPAAVLINGGTRSGKEVLAYGFKKYGYGDVMGTRSSGALLAGSAFLLANGGLLLVPVADVSLDGERIEGVGVTPTIEVERPIPYSAGADPQLEKALDLLARTTGG